MAKHETNEIPDPGERDDLAASHPALSEADEPAPFSWPRDFSCLSQLKHPGAGGLAAEAAAGKDVISGASEPAAVEQPAAARRNALSAALAWLGEAYREEKKDLPIVLGSTMVCIPATTAVMSAVNVSSPLKTALLSYTTGMTIYWGMLFFPALTFRDRAEFKDETGRLSAQRTWEKLKEYGKILCASEMLGSTVRFASVAAFNALGLSAPVSSLASQLLVTGIFLGAYPILRHAIRRNGQCDALAAADEITAS